MVIVEQVQLIDTPECLPQVEKFQHDLSEQVKAWQDGDSRARETIISSCFSLIHELETPSETLIRMTWGAPPMLGVFKTAIDLGLFQHLQDQAKTSTELAIATQSDPVLMIRILRCLAAIDVVKQDGRDAWTATRISKAMTQEIFVEAARFHIDLFVPAHSKIPEYLQQHEYRNSTDTLDTALTSLHSVPGKESAFQILGRLGRLHELDSVLKVWQMDRVHWSNEKQGFYPISKRLVNNSRKGEDEVFIVDVGGGQGGDLLNLLKLHSSIPGRIILQDVPETILKARLVLPAAIEAMAYDFFTPQPVRGARSYFMHSVLHDWPSYHVKTILSQTAAAMERGYSKLLIWDQIVPDVGCPPTYASLDWLMLTGFAGQERTETEWKALIESEDVQPRLKVNGFWYYSHNDQGIVEAELV